MVEMTALEAFHFLPTVVFSSTPPHPCNIYPKALVACEGYYVAITATICVNATDWWGILGNVLAVRGHNSSWAVCEA